MIKKLQIGSDMKCFRGKKQIYWRIIPVLISQATNLVELGGLKLGKKHLKTVFSSIISIQELNFHDCHFQIKGISISENIKPKIKKILIRECHEFRKPHVPDFQEDLIKFFNMPSLQETLEEIHLVSFYFWPGLEKDLESVAPELELEALPKIDDVYNYRLTMITKNCSDESKRSQAEDHKAALEAQSRSWWKCSIF